jgi:hypothetical protein
MLDERMEGERVNSNYQGDTIGSIPQRTVLYCLFVFYYKTRRFLATRFVFLATRMIKFRIRPDFVVHLHASLYGLILGILDDILANTKIQILSDDIDLDIVPTKEAKPKEEEPLSSEERTLSNSTSGEEVSSSASVGSFAAASFAAGIGTGVALMAIYTDSQR